MMTMQVWMVAAVVLATVASSGALAAGDAGTVEPAQGSEEFSMALRGRAAAVLGVAPRAGFEWSGSGFGGELQRSASSEAVLHGLVGQPFARATWALPALALPKGAALRSGPNPFHGGADMEFDLPEAGPVDLRVYDLTGREVRLLIGGRWFPAGTHAEAWDGRQRDGQLVSPGVYFARLRTAAGETCRRVVKL